MNKKKYDIDHLYKEKLASVQIESNTSADDLYNRIKIETMPFFPKPIPFYQKKWFVFSTGIVLGAVVMYISLQLMSATESSENTPTSNTPLNTTQAKEEIINIDNTTPIVITPSPSIKEEVKRVKKENLMQKNSPVSKVQPSLGSSITAKNDAPTITIDTNHTLPVESPKNKKDKVIKSKSKLSIFDKLRAKSKKDSTTNSLFKKNK